MSQSSKEELLEILDSQCNGHLKESDHKRIEELLLNGDPELAQLYVKYCDMHATLRWLSAPRDLLDAHTDDAKRISEIVQPNAWSRYKKSFGASGLLMLAASLLFALFTFWVGTNFATIGELPLQQTTLAANGSHAPDANASQEEKRVARITGLVDCQWLSGQQKFHFGSLLTSGERVELQEGLLQLTFDSGAKVIIQGPASFVPESAMEARLEQGKLSALVTESARGYTIKTPTAEVVDLGTEFAMEVEGNGATELHVLEGDVVARLLRPDGELHGEPIQAHKSQALRFGNEADDVVRMAANPSRFVRQITPKLTSEELPPLPIVSDLKFWVAADLLVTRRDGHVSAWRDVCIGDNQVGNDACQFSEELQPLWVADAGNGKPAIRFNGTSNRLITDEFSTGNQVSIFVAFVPSPQGQSNKERGGQLLNFGGFAPTIELSVLDDRTVYSGLWAANAFGKELCTGVVNHQQIVAGEPSVLCYTYDADADLAEQWINGYSTGSVVAPLDAKTKSTRTIGGHGNADTVTRFYRGDIQEVLIYDAVLADEDRQSVDDYLQQRYRTSK